MYNCEKFILRAVKSIQYQNISDIEIILVDDNSTDNTLIIAEKMQKEDQRIRLIKNQNNKGILYSRSIGVLSSKGKYLFSLDNDDMFLDDDIFHTITSIGETGPFDIVEFRALSNQILNQNILKNKIKNAIFTHPQSFVLFQPELGRYPIQTGNITGSYYLVDIFLWGKCIRTTIYQKALNKLGFLRYSRYMIRYEDILTNYMLFNTAQSFICVLKYGIYHINRIGSAASIGWMKVSRPTNILYLIDVVIDFSQDNSINKKLAVHLIIYFLKLRRVKRFLTSNEYNFNLINSYPFEII
jgi:glycosyltransferase involved in cell wall biosynthesis